jgi:hypothetical protein
MAEYAGESIAKKVARVRLYLRAKEMREAAGCPKAEVALVLAGPEAAELGCLRHILKPSFVCVVDKDERCVGTFQKKLKNLPDKGASMDVLALPLNVTDLHGIISLPIDFANLDLMGNLNGNPGEVIAPVAALMAAGGVVALTYLPGRLSVYA